MVLIRPLVETDMDRVASMTHAAYATAGHLDANDTYAQTLRDVEGRRAHGELLVAEVDGLVVGAVMLCQPESPYAEVSRTGEREFRFLAVDPEHWGRRIGEALARSCEDRARAAGAHTMVICVIDVNAVAHRLYGRLGYSRLPERDWQPRPGVDLQAYRKELA